MKAFDGDGWSNGPRTEEMVGRRAREEFLAGKRAPVELSPTLIDSDDCPSGGLVLALFMGVALFVGFAAGLVLHFLLLARAGH